MLSKTAEEDKMNGKALIIISMAMAVILMVTIPVTGQTGENEQLKKYYKDFISKCITKSQSKVGLKTSKSENLRNYSALSQQKVIFLTTNQNGLVDEMIKNKVGTKPYKIEYYLNKKFHETYH
jgi:hypothetical protein